MMTDDNTNTGEKCLVNLQLKIPERSYITDSNRANTSTSSSKGTNESNSHKNTPNTHVPGGNLSTANVQTKRTAIDFRFGKSIGEGSFSIVYLAKDIHTNKEYAIKVCEKHYIIREKKQEYIKREREALNMLSGCPGFMNLYCTFQDAKKLYFVMTYAKNGNLLPHINKVGSFDLQCSRFYAAELVLAIEEMHRRHIIHRDLKPENILLDENMHTLIADFGSSKICNCNDKEEQDDSSDNIEKDVRDGENKKEYEDEEGRKIRKRNHSRRRSFVGTAQYVSPEILKGKPSTKSTDLWALGCILYQMISGLPPFRAATEYLIFQKVLQAVLIFPDGFDVSAKDLVEKLLILDPSKRLGANDNGIYKNIRHHSFFTGIDWNNLRKQTPPQIYPYLPGVTPQDELRSQYRVPDHIEPGLDDKQMTRLLGLELGTSNVDELPPTNEPKNLADLTEKEKNQRLLLQKSDKWHQFTDGELIIKNGFVNKRKGLFARKRMLLLTTGPRLIYIDPIQMIKKGEIPWSKELRAEPKNFKIFFVHTPNRTYYLEDPEGYALSWCQAIDDVRFHTSGKMLG